MTQEKLKQIFDEYHKLLVAIAKGIIGDMYAEDIVSDVFIFVWLKDVKEGEQGIKGLLIYLVRMRCYEQIRLFVHKKTTNRKSIGLYGKCDDVPEHVEDYVFAYKTQSEEYADHRVIKAELLADMTRIIEKLPKHKLEVFGKLFFDGLTNTEAAKELRRHRNNVSEWKIEIVKSFKDLLGITIDRNRWVLVEGKRPRLTKK